EPFLLFGGGSERARREVPRSARALSGIGAGSGDVADLWRHSLSDRHRGGFRDRTQGCGESLVSGNASRSRLAAVATIEQGLDQTLRVVAQRAERQSTRRRHGDVRS